jgi:FAD/FMN-containing dehydrogenase
MGMTMLSAGVGRVAAGPRLNDIHSGLNPTAVDRVLRPRTVAEAQGLVRLAAAEGEVISISGGRHAMGGQQFARGAAHIDSTALVGLVEFDPEAGQVEVEAGITWPDLLRLLDALHPGETHRWTIRQKQTGADRMTLGGSLSANIHGRGLDMAPLVQDIEAFTLIDPSGALVRASRRENRELFALAIGGYGLFGVIATVRLRLVRRRILRREVEIVSAEELPQSFLQRRADGFVFGDWQFAIDPARSDFLRLGIFSCYRPTDAAAVPAGQRALAPDDWLRLLDMAHRDKHRGFQAYARHYLATHGQLYESDCCQLATYLDDYHRRLPAPACDGGEMITELYCPLEDLPAFLECAGGVLRRDRADVIYGTVRIARADRETFLPWAARDCACVIFNLHVHHSREGMTRAASAFRALIDTAIAFRGSYYLTYHRFATAEQLLACHPHFPAFLDAKLRHDPAEVFQSEWYRHQKRMLGRA